MTHLTCKGYLSTIAPDLDTGMLFGKLAYIRDLITYQASDFGTCQPYLSRRFTPPYS